MTPIPKLFASFCHLAFFCLVRALGVKTGKDIAVGVAGVCWSFHALISSLAFVFVSSISRQEILACPQEHHYLYISQTWSSRRWWMVLEVAGPKDKILGWLQQETVLHCPTYLHALSLFLLSITNFNRIAITQKWKNHEFFLSVFSFIFSNYQKLLASSKVTIPKKKDGNSSCVRMWQHTPNPALTDRPICCFWSSCPPAELIADCGLTLCWSGWFDLWDEVPLLLLLSQGFLGGLLMWWFCKKWKYFCWTAVLDILVSALQVLHKLFLTCGLLALAFKRNGVCVYVCLHTILVCLCFPLNLRGNTNWRYFVNTQMSCMKCSFSIISSNPVHLLLRALSLKLTPPIGGYVPKTLSFGHYQVIAKCLFATSQFSLHCRFYIQQGPQSCLNRRFAKRRHVVGFRTPSTSMWLKLSNMPAVNVNTPHRPVYPVPSGCTLACCDFIINLMWPIFFGLVRAWVWWKLYWDHALAWWQCGLLGSVFQCMYWQTDCMLYISQSVFTHWIHGTCFQCWVPDRVVFPVSNPMQRHTRMQPIPKVLTFKAVFRIFLTWHNLHLSFYTWPMSPERHTSTNLKARCPVTKQSNNFFNLFQPKNTYMCIYTLSINPLLILCRILFRHHVIFWQVWTWYGIQCIVLQYTLAFRLHVTVMHHKACKQMSNCFLKSPDNVFGLRAWSLPDLVLVAPWSINTMYSRGSLVAQPSSHPTGFVW